MKAVSFAQTPPSFPQTQLGTPGTGPAAAPPASPATPATPAASFGKKPAPKFGCAIEAALGCCVLPVMGLLGFVIFKVIKGIKKVGSLANKPFNGSSPQGTSNY